jgi:hypothetical protein
MPGAIFQFDHDQMKGIDNMKRIALYAAILSASATPALAHGGHSEMLGGILHVLKHNPIVLGAAGMMLLALITLRLRTLRK